jgi:hypothetical protein
MASRTVAAIGDKTLRERALSIVRGALRLAEGLRRDFLPRRRAADLSLVMSALARRAGEIRDRLIDERLRYPRRHPRAFYWYAKQLEEQETLPVARIRFPCFSYRGRRRTSSRRCARGWTF